MTLEQYIQNLNSAIFSADTNDLVSTNLPDFNHESIVDFAKKINLDFVPKKENGNVCFANNNDELRDDFKQVFETVDFLDYIYAVSFSAIYKQKFQKSFTKDFPKIPLPKVDNDFWKLVKLGREMREINLLESPCLGGNIAQFPVDGNNMVQEIKFESLNTTPPAWHPSSGGEFELLNSPPEEGNCIEGNCNDENLAKVFINDTQYFGNIPEAVWNLYIGNSQPAQKWLIDKNEQILESNNIKQYQRIITTLIEANRIIKQINKIIIQ